MKLKSSSIKGVAFAAYSIFVFALLIMPKFKYSVSYVELFAISLPLIALTCLLDATIIKKTYPIFLMLVFMALLRSLFNTWGNLSAAVNVSFVLYLGLLGYFLFEAMQKLDVRFASSIIVLSVLVMIFIVGFNTYREFDINPTVARILARGTNDDEEINLLRMSNIGGYGFSYAVGMLIPYVASLILRFTGIKRGISIGVFIVLFVYVFNTQYTTLLILSVVFSGLVFFLQSKSLYTKLAFLAITAVVVLGLKYVFLFLAENIKLDTLSSHFYDLYVTFSGEGDLTSRVSLQGDAFKLFFKNPIFGADLNDATNNYIVGHAHATFSSVLGSGGIVGTLLYYGCLYFPIRNIKKSLPTFRYIAPVFLHLTVLSILNPINAFEILIAVYFIVPTIELLIYRREEKKKYEPEASLGN